MSQHSRRWAVFISGRGSNLQALSEIPELDIALCVTSHLKIAGILRAKRAGIPVVKMDTKLGLSEWERIDQELHKRKIDRIFLLGFMRLIPSEFVQKWQGRIFNLHPSLLPLYIGKAAIENSYEAGSAMGVSIHHVTAEMDAGKVVLQKKILEASNSKKHAVDLSAAQFMISKLEQRLVRTWAAWN